MIPTYNNNRQRISVAKPDINSSMHQKLEAHLAEKRRKREALDNDLSENGVIHSVHFNEAEGLLYDYFFQHRDIKSLSVLERVKERISEFIDLLAIANDGPEAVKRQLEEFRNTQRNHPINVPKDLD